MKKGRIIKYLLLLVILIITVAFIISNSSELDRTKITLISQNEYSISEQTAKKLSKQANNNLTKAVTNAVVQDGEDGMGPDENKLPEKEITITMTEGNNIIKSDTVYPIRSYSSIKVKIEITNYDQTRTIHGLQILAFSGEEDKVDKRAFESAAVDVGPKRTYTFELSVRIKDPYLQFRIEAEDNMESYISQLYGFKVLNRDAQVTLVNVDHNLIENPRMDSKEVVYEEDTLKGEIVVYTKDGVGDGTEYLTEVSGEKYPHNSANGRDAYEKKTSLEIKIPLPSGVSIQKLQYQDNTGIYKDSTYNDRVYFSISTKNEIIVTIEKLEKETRAYITFDYTIKQGCSNFSIQATGTMNAKWKFKDQSDEVRCGYRNYIDNKKEYWHDKQDLPKPSVSEKIQYIVGHPRITVSAKEPYELETGNAGNVREGELLVYEFDITNTGNAPAVNLELTQKINKNLTIVAVNCEDKNSIVSIGKYTENGQVTAEIGRLDNGKTITIKVIVRSRILTNEEKEKGIGVTNTAELTGKKLETAQGTPIEKIDFKDQTIQINKSEKVEKVEQLTKEERDRLQESYALCDAIGEVHVRGFDKSTGLTYCYSSGGDVEHYCIEAHGSVQMRGGWLRDQVKTWAGSDPVETSSCGCANDVRHYKWYSRTHWQCVREHYTESSSTFSKRMGEDLYDIGFILSWTQKWSTQRGNGWTPEQAQAVWQSVMNKNGLGYSAYASEGTRLLAIATNYRNFWQKIVQPSEEKEFGIKPESLIDYETSEDKNNGNTQKTRMEISVNQEDELIKIGPFKLDYLDGSYTSGSDKYSFGGISDMYLLDENNNRINLENIIKEDGKGTGKASVYKVDYPDDWEANGPDNWAAYCNSNTPVKIYDAELGGDLASGRAMRSGGKTFFSIYEPGTSQTDKNTMDWHDDEKCYPKPGEEFYIEIKTKYDFNQDGKIDENDYVPAALKLKVDFQFMRSTASICIREGKYYYEDQSVSHGLHWHPGDDEDPGYYDHGNCTKTPRFAECDEDQDMLFVLAQNRMIYGESIIIPIGNGDYITTTMKVGGFVFQDQLQGKESNYDGKKQENDINLKNIEVSLYDAETNELVTLKTLKQERPEVKGANGNIENAGATDEEINDPNDYTRRTNPTLTDENGYYEFRGVPIGKRYYVKFTYNGQTYVPTDYINNLKDGNYDIKKLNEPNKYYGASEQWKESSKGTEKQSQRDDFNNRFATIGSSPLNYKSSDSLKSGALINGYNETFSNYELAGFYLDENGHYQQDKKKQLIDTYIEIQDKDGLDGQIPSTLVDTSDSLYKGDPVLHEGLISKAIKEFIVNDEEHQYPTEEEMKKIYAGIVSKVPEEAQTVWKKLQFIEDCKMDSYTKDILVEQESNFNTYPYPDYYTILIQGGTMYPNNSYQLGTASGTGSELYDSRGTYAEIGNIYLDKTYYQNGPTTKMVNDHTSNAGKGTITYINVYPGQLFINQGLIVRQDTDMSLRKDVFKATLNVNGKTAVYEYNTREFLTTEQKDELRRLRAEYEANRENQAAYQAYLDYKEKLDNKYWEIQGKILNYANYYGEKYNREIYQSDYYFPGNSNGENKLEAYVTYKITILNQSQSLLTTIDEIVDYYDDTYTFVPEKSWMMYYEGNDINNNEYVTVPDQDFYDIMTGDLAVGTGKYRRLTSYTPKNEQIAPRTVADFSEEFAEKNYKTVYIRDLKEKLQSGEEEYVYLTFKVNGEGSGLSIEGGKTEEGKQNIVEINEYTTYYKDGTKLPNGITKGSNDVAGKIDVDSNPGNFRAVDISPDGSRYEHHFEDDTDRARGIRVYIDEEMIRKISGTAWEDKREIEVEEAIVGNGIKDDKELRIKDIQVQLLEIILDDKGNPKFDNNGDIITQVADINSGGESFKEARVTTNENGEYIFEGIVPGDYIVRFTYGGEFNPYYNGQDYKTTSYQVGITQDNNTRTDVAKTDEYGYVGYSNLGNYNDSGNNYGQNASGTYGYDIEKADSNELGNVSDAKDLWRLRAAVNKYSSSNYQGVTYEKANTLSKNETANENTQMIADTGSIRIEFEYNRQNSNANTVVNANGLVNVDGEKINNNGYKGTNTERDTPYATEGIKNTGENTYQGQNNSSQNYYNGTYHIENVDLGLEERPKAGLELNKKITNIKVTLANQRILFDANAAMHDLLWVDKEPYQIQQLRNDQRNQVYEYYGKDNYTKFRNKVASHIDSLVSNKKGLRQITMDEEIMHGATITITYDMTVTNIGEVDYKETQFYYKATELGVKDTKNIVKTAADVVVDYVSNNLTFKTAENNSSWKNVTEKVKQGEYEINIENKGKDFTKSIFNKYNTIIQTSQSETDTNETGLSKALIPASTKKSNNKNDAKEILNLGNSQTGTKLILTQLITPQNSDDDKCYNNIAEIVKISNDVGRRMAFSVQGNQNPTAVKDSTIHLEADASMAEEVKILPPFGSGNTQIYIILAGVVLTILTAGIILIKKKVL